MHLQNPVGQQRSSTLRRLKRKINYKYIYIYIYIYKCSTHIQKNKIFICFHNLSSIYMYKYPTAEITFEAFQRKGKSASNKTIIISAKE